jgi:nucleotide-binding universal stress UspA family protein
MYHVVVGVDDNEPRALASARAVVDLPGAAAETTATLVHSFTDRTDGDAAAEVDSVRAAVDALADGGIDAAVVGTTGDPVERILEVAADEDADLLVLAGRKRSPAGKALFGSVSRSVILRTDRPVMVVGDATG